MATITPEDFELYSETGWFGSKIVKSVKKAAKGVAKGVSSAAKTAGKVASSAGKVASVVPGVGTAVGSGLKIAGAGLQGKNVVKATVSQAKTLANPKTLGRNLAAAGQVAQFVPGIGTAVGAAARVAGAGLQGQNVAKAAINVAKTSSPYVTLAIQAANAATAIAKGQNVTKALGSAALGAAASYVPEGQAALRIGSQLASGKNIKTIAANEAKAQLSRLVGGAASKAIGSVSMNVLRPGVVNPLAAATKSIAPQFAGNRPIFAAPARNAALRLVRYVPPSGAAKRLIQSRAGALAREVSGLNSDGTYTVESGDTGTKIAKALTGDGNRWTELKAVNPTIMKARASQVAQYGFPIYKGDVINLPASWVKPAVTPVEPVPTTPTVPVPTIPTVVAPAADLAAQATARATLVAWASTEGKDKAGVSDYGGAQELTAISWTARDKLQAASFENFYDLPDKSGEWNQTLADTLRTWAEKKATQVITQPSTPAPIPPAPSANSTPTAPTPPSAAPTPADTTPAPSITIPGITLPGGYQVPGVTITSPGVTPTVPTPPSATSNQAASTEEKPGFIKQNAPQIAAAAIGTGLTVLAKYI